MKWLFLLNTIILLSACKKDGYKSNEPLYGVWVEKSLRQDTLHVYRSGNKTIMFDNSLQYRMSGRMFPNDAFYRHEVLLRNDSIGFKFLDEPANHPFRFYFFKWENRYDEFTMSYNGLRLYLSSMGTITYVRVRR
jgi:hypothetical protein